MNKLFIFCVSLLIAAIALGEQKVEEYTLEDMAASYEAGVTDTLNHVYIACIEDGMFILGSTEGEEKEFICVEKAGFSI